MRTCIMALAVALSGLTAVLASVPASGQATEPAPATVESPGGPTVAHKVVGSTPGRVDLDPPPIQGPGKSRVVVLDAPDISGGWILRGTGRAVGAEPAGVRLTLWNEINGQWFFSRGRFEPDPATDASGRFALPFVAGAGVRPARLVLEAEVPEGVTLTLDALHLDAMSPDQFSTHSGPAPWFSSRWGGLLGGLLGSTLGLLGAFVGVARSRGSNAAARNGLRLMIFLGGALLATGIVAWLMGQPYHVYFPLALAGLISCSVVAFVLPVLRGQAAADEHRRMRAADV